MASNEVRIVIESANVLQSANLREAIRFTLVTHESSAKGTSHLVRFNKYASVKDFKEHVQDTFLSPGTYNVRIITQGRQCHDDATLDEAGIHYGSKVMALASRTQQTQSSVTRTQRLLRRLMDVLLAVWCLGTCLVDYLRRAAGRRRVVGLD
uniref:Ubiquitin-like domain-containing protein n=1 Tax=Eutreptiella gymnastica TaxID=73025 RepID=A0A7S1IAZ4_9EUGL|mmetsp:Transcript_143902/g.251170  ORF Transcript_143902/g.251170 Transcript_143902/m.251170 type:complete len:152 (+) Transcript_143902:304-759(+)